MTYEFIYPTRQKVWVKFPNITKEGKRNGETVLVDAAKITGIIERNDGLYALFTNTDLPYTCEYAVGEEIKSFLGLANA